MEENSFITTIGYFPPIEFFVRASQNITWLIESHETYQKGGIRNRYSVMSSHGIATLSVPLEQGKNNGLPIKLVKIANTQNWQKLHWNTLTTNYGKSAFFIHYEPYLSQFYSKKYEYLFDLCIESIQLLIKLMKIDVQLNFTEKFFKDYSDEKIEDLRSKNMVHHTTKIAPLTYPQVFQDRLSWVENLSALDLLFCMGPESKKILEKSKILYL